MAKRIRYIKTNKMICLTLKTTSLVQTSCLYLYRRPSYSSSMSPQALKQTVDFLAKKRGWAKSTKSECRRWQLSVQIIQSTQVGTTQMFQIPLTFLHSSSFPLSSLPPPLVHPPFLHHFSLYISSLSPQLNRLYGMYLQCQWSLCWCDIFCLSMLLSILCFLQRVSIAKLCKALY